jgi:hypothetical protein
MPFWDHFDRREFLKRAGTTAAALALGAKSTQAREQNPVLGTGAHRYECLHDWLLPPAGMSFGDTHGLAQDSAGRIYLAHTVHPSSESKDAVVVYDEYGNFLRSWGSAFRGGAHGLDLRMENGKEFLYHCDIQRRLVVKTDLSGNVIWELGAPAASAKYRNAEPFVPTNVAFIPNGDFYIADGYGSNWIHQYDAKANYLRTFGGSGSDPGKVSQPHGLWVDERGAEPTLAVADRANRRIQYFSLDGKHIRFCTDGMRLPCHFSTLGELMVVPDLASVITVLDRDNRVIVSLGDGDPSGLRGKPRSEFVPGKFIHPHDAIFLRSGDILVAEWVPIGRVTLLRKIKN